MLRYKRFIIKENVDQEINNIISYINTQVIVKRPPKKPVQPTQQPTQKQPDQQQQKQPAQSNMNKPSIQDNQPKNTDKLHYQTPTNEPKRTV